MANRAVFIDRDGTIVEDVNYCRSPEDLRLFSTTAKAIKLLNINAFKIILITNQSGVARGYFTEDTLVQIHHKMEEELSKAGAHIDAIYYCPHHPEDNCDCRKPKPKLVLQAAKTYDIDLDHSFVVGDDDKDILLGKSVGCNTILINNSPSINQNVIPDLVVPDPLEAAQSILKWRYQ
ncbi:D-glycero-alpha-D-manno-heptose-1,7-bisphosphate 7-phosphatase [Chloroflexota bacterium]